MSDQEKASTSSSLNDNENEMAETNSLAPPEASSSSFMILKTWDFDGLKIELIYKPQFMKPEDHQSTEQLNSEDGDDASTVALDENETVQEILNDLIESESNCSEAAIKDDQKLKVILEEVDTEKDSVNDQFEGAAGLWALESVQEHDVQVSCFAAPPVASQSKYENVALQQSSYEWAANSTDWFVPQPQTIQVSHSLFYQKPDVGSHFEDLTNMSNETLVNNKEVDDCTMCERPIDVGRGVVIKGCLHVFCRRCLIHAIENNATAIMTCPSKLVCCQSEIGDEEIKALLSPEAYDKYVTEMLCKMINFNELEELYCNNEYVENRHLFQCGICLTMVDLGDGLTLKNCLHQYCKTCLIKYIQNEEGVDLPCPFRTEDGNKCIGNITDSEMRSIAPIEVYLAYLGKSIALAEAQNPNAYHCKTPNCKVFVEIIGQLEEFECEGCKGVNCIGCKAVHQGITCNEYQAMQRRTVDNSLTEGRVRELVGKKEAQACPRCGVIVQRIDGCRHLTCIMCRHEFIWLGV